MKNIVLQLVKNSTKQLEGTGIGKIKPLFALYAFLLSFLKPKIVETEGSRMYLDKYDSLLLSVYPNFEPSVTSLIKKFIKEGMIVVDAGAYIGYFTLLMSRLVGSKGKVHAFEPGLENFKLLEKNVKLNNYLNVKVNRLALSDKKGEVKLFISPNNPQDHRITSNSESKAFEKIRTTNLDKYFQNNLKVDFIKMDIQGAEILALKGAKKLLEKNKKLKMIIEFWPYALVKAGYKPEDMINMLKKYGSLKLINEKNGKLEPISKINLNKTGEKYLYNFFFQGR